MSAQKSVRFQQESPSVFTKGGCPLSARIRVRFQQELLSALRRNCCPLCARMSVRFGQEYALGNGSDRVVFNIGGNNYRLICKYHFGNTRVHLFIKWIGSHAEYTKLCNEGKQYEIDVY